MQLPNRIFYQGAPGTTWSGIAQFIEQVPGFNTTDRNASREYNHNGFDHSARPAVAPEISPIFIGHRGAFFGKGMEFEADPSAANIDQAWEDPTAGTQLIKSHEWVHCFDEVMRLHPEDWIVLVYRNDMHCLAWQHEVGGFNVKYPNYDWYKNSRNLFSHITWQNELAMEFSFKHDLTWSHFSNRWVKETFGSTVNITKQDADVLVTCYKPQ